MYTPKYVAAFKILKFIWFQDRMQSILSSMLWKQKKRAIGLTIGSILDYTSIDNYQGTSHTCSWAAVTSYYPGMTNCEGIANSDIQYWYG